MVAKLNAIIDEEPALTITNRARCPHAIHQAEAVRQPLQMAHMCGRHRKEVKARELVLAKAVVKEASRAEAVPEQLSAAGLLAPPSDRNAEVRIWKPEAEILLKEAFKRDAASLQTTLADSFPKTGWSYPLARQS